MEKSVVRFFNRPPSWFFLLAGSAVFFLCCLLMMLVATVALNSQVRDGADRLIARFDALSEESQGIFNKLNASGFSRCDELTLLAMRRVLFDASYVTDVGFLQGNELVCTANSGLLSQPVSYGEADYIGPLGIEMRVRKHLPLLLFENRFISAFDVRKGSFNLVIELEKIEAIATSSAQQWQIIFLDETQPLHLAGREGLYQSVTHQIGYQASCSEKDTRYCIAVRLPLADFLLIHRLELLLALSICLMLSIASHFSLRSYLRSLRSTPTRVRRGLNKGHFYWLYQPIVELETGRWIGCEALARFEDCYGTLTPDLFIPELRKLQLTWPFTELMVERVFNDLETVSQLPNSFKVSLNIFPVDIERGRVTTLFELPALRSTRLTVCLEVTEDDYLDAPAARNCLSVLSQKGVIIAIDDFGTGYSNLKNLAEIRFDVLKIDRTFVMDIETAGLKMSLIPPIVKLAQQFGCLTVAEGIESAAQESILRKAGVDFGQGWRYGKPMKVEALKEAFPT